MDMVIGVRSGDAIEYAYAWSQQLRHEAVLAGLLRTWAEDVERARCLVGFGRISGLEMDKIVFNGPRSRPERTSGDTAHYVRTAVMGHMPEFVALFDGEAEGWQVWRTGPIAAKVSLTLLVEDLAETERVLRSLLTAFQSAARQSQRKGRAIRKRIRERAGEIAESYGPPTRPLPKRVWRTSERLVTLTDRLTATRRSRRIADADYALGVASRCASDALAVAHEQLAWATEDAAKSEVPWPAPEREGALLRAP